jgi:hypothetical protein
MALCSNSQFTLTRNTTNDFVFTIKENGKTTAMPIAAGDTFTLHLIRLDDNKTIVDLTSNLTVLDALNGKLRLYLTELEVNALLSLRGPVEDRYYLKPVYSLIIEANTLVNGVFVARIGNVYVG